MKKKCILANRTVETIIITIKLKMNNMSKTIILATVLALAFSTMGFAQVYKASPLSGKAQTQEFIQRNLVYPAEALGAGKSGKVVVAFHLDEAGNGSDYQVRESFCEAANPIALDLVRKILWEPATKDMKPIATDMEYEVEFNARAYKRFWKKRQRVEVPLVHEADDSYDIHELRHLEEAAKPYFPEGGNMANYILNNLKYPEAAKSAEIHGTVRLDFVVETDGSVSNIVIKNSVGGGCDNEAIRLLQETHWIPAVKNGKYVRTRNEQDITFNIGHRNFQDGNAY